MNGNITVKTDIVLMISENGERNIIFKKNKKHTNEKSYFEGWRLTPVLFVNSKND